MTILVFVGIGWFLDSRLHTIPLFLLIFMFLGFGGALYSLTKKFPSDSPAPKKRAPADSAQNVTKPPDRNDSGESEDNNSSAQD
ncbi:MAG: AtpZ/AtpI family protein [Planctomycetes bacterium]|nr:AtpZ/AtpI family protein [Planctomycetota bacterium]